MMIIHRPSQQVERVEGLAHLRVPAGQRYVTPGQAYVEGDASSASYFLAGVHKININLFKLQIYEGPLL